MRAAYGQHMHTRMAKHADKGGAGEAEQDSAAIAPAAANLAAVEATPSMAQYLEIKTANPDSLLWYRMGDFYELFFEDAVAASQALSIVLTKRGKHLGNDIPMCGVPVHRSDEYLQKLIRQGYRVAVCEQLEDPAEARKRGAKAVVKRDVVRLVTPGTLTEDALLDAKARNYLTAVFCVGPFTAQAKLATASVDISTGECEIGVIDQPDLTGELVRLAPGEVLAADSLLAHDDVRRAIELAAGKPTPVPAQFFDSVSGARDLKDRLGVADLSGFGSFERAELAAAGAVLKYIDLTQMGQKPLLRPPKKSGFGSSLLIDAGSRASLEIIRAQSGDKSSSLLGAMDRTVTGPGARELQARLSSPLADADAINGRLDAVAFLIEHRRLTDTLQQLLRRSSDVARAMSRLSFGRGGPRDLAAVRDGAEIAISCVRELTQSAQALGLPEVLADAARRLQRPQASLITALKSALAEDLPHLKRDGGFIAARYSADLDAARELRDGNRNVMAQLEARYAEQTGVKTLKIRHNNILGFYVEVTQLNAKPLLSKPLDETFRHRQTMANAVRFTTAELVEIEGQIASASERALKLELEIFEALVSQIQSESAALTDAASALAELDCFAGLAQLAAENNYVRPSVDDSDTFDIRAGRHPVVEQALKRSQAGAFIANDCTLVRAGTSAPPGFDEMPVARVWLVTGPNMAGKSTFLRQNALLTVMAQMGSYVPAASAHIGVADRLFSRVGASDDLARGRSTFMVEMVETAAILNQATPRSIVILDEIGRGTATFDGLSIAWATVEYLHGVSKARALFATHYHELTALARKLPGIANVTMDVTEWQDKIVFLHKTKPGAADRSYGIQVAKLAGLPGVVVKRAQTVLALLEKNERSAPQPQAAFEDLPLFSVARPISGSGDAEKPSAVLSALRDLRPDELSPKSALEKLYELKALASAEQKSGSAK